MDFEPSPGVRLCRVWKDSPCVSLTVPSPRQETLWNEGGWYGKNCRGYSKMVGRVRLRTVDPALRSCRCLCLRQVLVETVVQTQVWVTVWFYHLLAV